MLLLLCLVADGGGGAAAAPPSPPITRVLICLPLLLTCLSFSSWLPIAIKKMVSYDRTHVLHRPACHTHC